MKTKNPLLPIFEKLPKDPVDRIPEDMRLLIRNGNFRFDVHTHIFNRDYIPDKFFEIRIPYLVNSDFLQYVEDIFSQIEEFPEGSDLLNYAYFIDFATKHSMDNIAQYMINNSPKNTIFAVIALDLQQALDGEVKKDYIDQLENLARIRDKYPDIILPFFEVNPNNPDFELIIEKALLEYSFFGIKIYPSMGYMPSHPKLMQLFELCEQWNIPVITHCSSNNMHTTKNLLRIEYFSFDENGQLELRSQKKMFLFRNQYITFFNRPQNWEPVLKTYPNLRINFSHMGGDDDWDGRPRTDRNWSFRIFDFMERYENVYSDTAYTFHLDTFIELLSEVLYRNKLLTQRILFGSDYYMIMAEGKYKNLRSKFALSLGTDLMQQISVVNPLRFLGLEKLIQE